MHRTDNADSVADDIIRDDALAYSVPDAAAVIAISERRLWDHIRAGKIRSFRDGSRRLISRKALEEYIDKRETA